MPDSSPQALDAPASPPVTVPDERQVRSRLADVEMTADAMRRYPLRRDLGWQRVQLALLDAEAARLRRIVAIGRVLGGS